MAVKEKKRMKMPPVRPKRRIGLKIAAALVVLLGLGVLGMHISSRIIHVRYATVHLSDLPQSFDGTTILFASDIDLCGVNSPSQADRLFGRLQSLHPDLLLLGGDYASPSLIDRLNGGSDEKIARRDFFRAISDFEAPLGKYAVSGDNDGDVDALKLTVFDTGVQLLDGQAALLSRGDDTLVLAGIGSDTGSLSGLAGGFKSDQCVIALMHTPGRVVDVRIAEAQDGGPWADLILAGHTHAGQLQIAGRTALSLDDVEKRYLTGWFNDAQPLLVTSGVGCEGANFRLGTQAEVWMITLKCTEPVE